MYWFLGLLWSIGWVTFVLVVLDIFMLIILVLTIILPKTGLVLREERFNELCQQHWFGRFCIALHPLAFWWINGPMYLYWRLRGRRVTFANPKPKKSA